MRDGKGGAGVAIHAVEVVDHILGGKTGYRSVRMDIGHGTEDATVAGFVVSPDADAECLDGLARRRWADSKVLRMNTNKVSQSVSQSVNGLEQQSDRKGKGEGDRPGELSACEVQLPPDPFRRSTHLLCGRPPRQKLWAFWMGLSQAAERGLSASWASC